MEPKFNTSFIPKKSLQADTSAGGSQKKYVSRRNAIHGPGFFLMLLLFIICIIASVGVFGYTVIVDSRIEEYKNRLEEKKQAFKQSVIDDLIRMDLRINLANELLMNHVAISQVFEKLEEVTLKNVQYMSFSYEGKGGETMMQSMNVAGVANNFQDVALQTRTYRLDQNLQNPVVLELEKQENNNVDFQVETGIDERLTSFSMALKENRLQSGTQTTNTPETQNTPEVSEDENEAPNEEVNNTATSTES